MASSLHNNNYQYAFIGVMFCVVAIWATMFVRDEQDAMPVNVIAKPTAICSCYHSPMQLRLDASGVIPNSQIKAQFSHTQVVWKQGKTT